MDVAAFSQRHLSAHPNGRTVANWWSALATNPESPKALDFHHNVERDDIFEHENGAPSRVGNFADQLAIRLDCLTRPAGSAFDILNSAPIMFFGGPSVSRHDDLYRFVSVSTIMRRCTNDDYNLSPLPTDPDGQRQFAELLRHSWYFDQYVNPSALIRGALPLAFWAFASDVQQFGLNQPLPDLMRFLGLEPATVPMALVSFGLSDQSLGGVGPAGTGPRANPEPTFVPTGWDAGDHAYFWPQPRGSATGITWDRNQTAVRGCEVGTARELVTKPIPFGQTRIVEVYMP